MLLNLSNHPSKLWADKQHTIALEKYHKILDIPFPIIDPNMNDTALDNLVADYEQKIINLHPIAIHIMGEMTFVYRLVSRLKPLGIECIASTTERIVQEQEGIKTSFFNFVQFRNY